MNRILSRFTKSEARIFYSCVVVAVLCVFLLTPWGETWLSSSVHNTLQPPIGQVASQENEVLHRTKYDLFWSTARRNQTVRRGDAVFAGAASTAKVILLNNDTIVVGENSLVVFDGADLENPANLQFGNFRIKVKDTLHVNVLGRHVELKGQQSEVQVFVDKNRQPKIRLLSGAGTVKVENLKPVVLNQQPVKLEPSHDQVPMQHVPVPDPRPEPERAAQAPLPPINEVPTNLREAFEERYFYKFQDVYLRNERLLTETQRPRVVPVNFALSWKTAKYILSRVEVSPDPSFSENLTVQSENTEVLLKKAYLGLNYWRVAIQQDQWSVPEHFTVEPRFRTDVIPLASPLKQVVALMANRNPVQIDLSTAAFKPQGFVVQASTHAQFPAKRAKLYWSASSTISLNFSNPGDFYYRFRTVAANGELSAWSQTAQVTAISPEMSSRIAPVVRRSAEPASPQRKTASIATSTAMIREKPLLENPNSNFKSSQLSVNGFLWSLYSSEQIYASEPNPITSGLGIHGYCWAGSHGLEGSLKTGVVAVNEAGQSQTSLKDIEARYHYRLLTHDLWGLTHELQVSLFGGVESYETSGASFVNRYSLTKAGTTIEFPLGKRWMTGGELVYGWNGNRSQKKEISGNINYFLSPGWSFGVGYRVHLFDAGGAHDTPYGVMPYREGYTEGFSVLNFHY